MEENPAAMEKAIKDYAKFFGIGAAIPQVRIYKSGDYTYFGFSLPGTATSTPEWRIVRMHQVSSSDIRFQHADGNLKFDNVWDDFESLVYE